jgi:hypothetical protein
MESMNQQILEYHKQLIKGIIQKAYRRIMAFMTTLQKHLETRHPEYAISGLYPGYMDMTYFAVTPPEFKAARLKIALVYLHESNTFEVWLAAANRRIQADTIEHLKNKVYAPYTLSTVSPGTDSILAAVIADKPDFDHPEALMQHLTAEVKRFSQDTIRILSDLL